MLYSEDGLEPLVLGFTNLPPEFGIFYSAVRLVQGVIILLGNGLTIFAVIRYPTVRNQSGILVGYLALADTTAFWGTILAPLYDYKVSKTEKALRILCQTKELVNLGHLFGNIVSILLISIDRFIYCCFPVNYREIVTTKRCYAVAIFFWVYGMGAAVISIFVFSSYSPGIICTYSNGEFLPSEIFYGFYMAQLGIFSLITVCCYGRIGYLALTKAREAKLSRLRVQSTEQPSKDLDEFDKRQIKITKTLAIILGLYFALYTPGAILSIVVERDSPMGLAIVYHLSIILFQINACLNPLIYARGLKDFNNAFKKIFQGFKNRFRINLVTTVNSTE